MMSGNGKTHQFTFNGRPVGNHDVVFWYALIHEHYRNAFFSSVALNPEFAVS